LGFVLRELDKLGVTNIGHELVTDVLVYKQRVPRVPSVANGAKPGKKTRPGRGGSSERYEITNKNFVMQHFHGKDQVTSSEMAELFKKNGRKPNSAGAVLTLLGHQKYCKSMGDGVWKILAKGQQAAAKDVANG
jgi:hypothetical protein